MSVEDPGNVSYNEIGGLGEQIRELREVHQYHKLLFNLLWFHLFSWVSIFIE